MGMEYAPHMALELLTVESGAAPIILNIVSAAAGEMWHVQEVDIYHDDPAGATLQWEIVGEGGQTLVLTIGAVAINVHTKLSDYYATPFWIGPEWIVRIRAAGALAAGKKFYGCYHTSKIRGIPGGSLR